MVVRASASEEGAAGKAFAAALALTLATTSVEPALATTATSPAARREGVQSAAKVKSTKAKVAPDVQIKVKRTSAKATLTPKQRKELEQAAAARYQKVAPKRAEPNRLKGTALKSAAEVKKTKTPAQTKAAAAAGAATKKPTTKKPAARATLGTRPSPR